jgi:hypothetical protein
MVLFLYKKYHSQGFAMQKKIAIIGSCISRDNFNSVFNKNYKMFFDCILHQHQSSILSLMSEKVPFSQSDLNEKMNNFAKWQLRTEHTKEFLSLLKERKPDYLLLDFFGDIYYGSVDLGQGNYMTFNEKTYNLPLVKGNPLINLENNPKNYFAVWQDKIKELFTKIKKDAPNCKIILVKSRLKDSFKNGSSLTNARKQKGTRVINIEQLNKMWEMLDNHVISNLSVQVIDMTGEEYYLDENHPWGSFYVHYNMDFYHDFFNKLQLLIMNDLHENLLETHRKIEALNKNLWEAQKKAEALNKSLKKKVNFYDNESFNHALKRYLLKNSSIKKINDFIKER